MEALLWGAAVLILVVALANCVSRSRKKPAITAEPELDDRLPRRLRHVVPFSSFHAPICNSIDSADFILHPSNPKFIYLYVLDSTSIAH